MKVYVAGKFEDKPLIRELQEKLNAAGHTLAYDWTTHKPIKPYAENQDLASQYSVNELNGIINSDVFIYLSHEKGTTLLMEFGAALALQKSRGKPIVYAVGDYNDRSPWFFNPLIKRRNTIEEVISELKET